jgi:hypothetical protein
VSLSTEVTAAVSRVVSDRDLYLVASSRVVFGIAVAVSRAPFRDIAHAITDFGVGSRCSISCIEVGSGERNVRVCDGGLS